MLWQRCDELVELVDRVRSSRGAVSVERACARTHVPDEARARRARAPARSRLCRTLRGESLVFGFPRRVTAHLESSMAEGRSSSTPASYSTPNGTPYRAWRQPGQSWSGGSRVASLVFSTPPRASTPTGSYPRAGTPTTSYLAVLKSNVDAAAAEHAAALREHADAVLALAESEVIHAHLEEEAVAVASAAATAAAAASTAAQMAAAGAAGASPSMGHTVRLRVHEAQLSTQSLHGETIAALIEALEAARSLSSAALREQRAQLVATLLERELAVAYAEAAAASPISHGVYEPFDPENTGCEQSGREFEEGVSNESRGERGATEAGATEAGATENGATDAGATEAGTAEECSSEEGLAPSTCRLGDADRQREGNARLGSPRKTACDSPPGDSMAGARAALTAAEHVSAPERAQRQHVQEMERIRRDHALALEQAADERTAALAAAATERTAALVQREQQHMLALAATLAAARVHCAHRCEEALAQQLRQSLAALAKAAEQIRMQDVSLAAVRAKVNFHSPVFTQVARAFSPSQFPHLSHSPFLFPKARTRGGDRRQGREPPRRQGREARGRQGSYCTGREASRCLACL